MINNHRFKWHLEELNKANSALLGISRVMDAINSAEQHGEAFALNHNHHVRNCLTNGIDVITSCIAQRLDDLAAMTGVEA